MLISDKNEGSREARKKDREELDAPSFPSPTINVIPAQVAAIHRGMMRVGIRVDIGGRTDLRIRWPAGYGSKQDIRLGQSVNALIPAEDVHLEAGYFRQGKRRWNRWIGRIVLVQSVRGERVITVKLHGDQVTLKSCGPITGSNWLPQAWDTVNIVVDPMKVSLDTTSRNDGDMAKHRDMEVLDHFQDARVWLRAQIIALGNAPEGKVLSLIIGSARVSAFVGLGEDSCRHWIPGMAVDIHVDRYDAWLKPQSRESPLVRCGLLYLDHQTLASMR